MRMATVEKEWCEVRRKGEWKIEDWSWRVDYLDRGVWKDAHYINNEADAKMVASLFEAGAFTRTEFGDVSFDTAFA